MVRRRFFWIALLCGFAALGVGTNLVMKADRQEAVSPTIVREFGFIRLIGSSAEGAYLNFDNAELLTGDEAVEEVRMRGLCEDAHCRPPNDYIIRNGDSIEEVFPISPDAKIIMQTWKNDMQESRGFDRPVGLDEFLSEWNNGMGELYSMLPFHITITDGIVVSITEQYTP